MIRNKEKLDLPAAKPAVQDDARLWEMQADICQILANPKRLEILNLLKWGELSVGQMVQAIGVAKANLSQHLAVMRQKGILATRREGTTIYYRLATPSITEACEIMREVLLESLSAKERLSRSMRRQDAEAGDRQARETE